MELAPVELACSDVPAITFAVPAPAVEPVTLSLCRLKAFNVAAPDTSAVSLGQTPERLSPLAPLTLASISLHLMSSLGLPAPLVSIFILSLLSWFCDFTEAAPLTSIWLRIFTVRYTFTSPSPPPVISRFPSFTSVLTLGRSFSSASTFTELASPWLSCTLMLELTLSPVKSPTWRSCVVCARPMAEVIPNASVKNRVFIKCFFVCSAKAGYSVFFSALCYSCAYDGQVFRFVTQITLKFSLKLYTCPGTSLSLKVIFFNRSSTCRHNSLLEEFMASTLTLPLSSMLIDTSTEALKSLCFNSSGTER